MSKISSFVFLGLLAICGLTKATEVFDPYPPGPYRVLSLHYSREFTGLAKSIEVWAPENSTEHATVIYFTQSLAATITPRAVKEVLELVTSWGFVIIGPWFGGSANYNVSFIDPIIDYAEENILRDLIEAGANPAMTLDFSRMIMMGHSAGNHINVNYLKQTCRNFVAGIFLSPVDGADPFGIVDEYCIEPGQLLNFKMPTLTVQAALDPVPGRPLFPACAPARLSNKRFYDAMPGNRWFMNATRYGHVDFFEQDFIDAVEALSFCASNNETDKDLYRHYTAGTIVAFAKAVLEPVRYCDMLSYVENPLVMISPTMVERDVNSNTRCQPARCEWSEPPPKPSTTASPGSPDEIRDNVFH